jgi:26S proteasome regulatory subunit N12
VVSFTSAEAAHSANAIPKKATIATNLVFAKELESIV